LRFFFIGCDQQLAADLGEDSADIDVEHVRHRLAHPRPHVLQRIRRRTSAPERKNRRDAKAIARHRQIRQVNQVPILPNY
jgi:hypothetical protein